MEPPPQIRIGPSDRPPPRHILVAEDDDALRFMLATALRTAGYVVTEAQDGRELLDAIEAVPPRFFDLVIADHWMPRMDGIDALAELGNRAAFVILTGADDPALPVSAEKLGAVAVLHKPVGLTDLLAVVRVALAVR